jgi:hypothetical protein
MYFIRILFYEHILITHMMFMFRVYNVITAQNVQPVCSSKNCLDPSGECVNGICLCAAGYTTLESKWNNIPNEVALGNDSNSYVYCNYAFKYKDSAAYYEAILPFGVGHFYTSRFLHGFIKFVLFWILSLAKVIFKKKIRLFPELEKTITVLMWIFLILYVVDYFAFTFNYYKDGNDMILL